MYGHATGGEMTVVETRAAPTLSRPAPGLLIAVLVAAIATVAGTFVPVIGGPVFGIVLGAVTSAVIPGLRHPRFTPGYAVAGRTVLQLSIVVLGAGLSLRQVVDVGVG